MESEISTARLTLDREADLRFGGKHTTTGIRGLTVQPPSCSSPQRPTALPSGRAVSLLVSTALSLPLVPPVLPSQFFVLFRGSPLIGGILMAHSGEPKNSNLSANKMFTNHSDYRGRRTVCLLHS